MDGDKKAIDASKPTVKLRRAALPDIPHIAELSRRVYGAAAALTEDMVRGQIVSWPDGQFVVEYDGHIVGHCGAFLIAGEAALAPHSWAEITGHGYASRHDPNGDYLYGMDVVVDPRYRRLRIGKRLYRARHDLAQRLGLRGIVFGGRMPGLQRRWREFGSAETYLQAVLDSKLKDPVVTFHLAAGFRPIGVLKDYLDIDRDSMGYATHMVWRNPRVAELDKLPRRPVGQHLPDSVRVAVVQWQMRRLDSLDEFESQIEYWIDVASDYNADFLVLPELFTLQLLSLSGSKRATEEATAEISPHRERFVALIGRLAVSYNINVVAGSILLRDDDGQTRNTAFVCLRDGSIHRQDKIHPTPAEQRWWNVAGGETAAVIPTDCGPIGVLVGYDAEFPEIARHLADQGALLLFVPFCTDERRGFLRVRYCCHARAIENQVYVAMAGVVGNLPNVENMDIHYAESCILTPCDFPFARDGVAAEAGANTETIAIGDLRLTDLFDARSNGTVRHLVNRRFELYRVDWLKRPQ